MYCSTCNVESGPTLFCHVCDNYLPTSSIGLKAGIVRRFAAVILDNIVAFTILALSIRWLLSLSGNVLDGNIIVAVVSCFSLIAYTAAFFSSLSLGMTPGKWVLGIRAIDKRNGTVPGLGRMFVREVIGKFVSGFFMGLGFFWAIWDRDSQAWHDKLAGTVVIRRDVTVTTEEPSSAWPIVAGIAFFTVLGLQAFNIINPNHSPRSGELDNATTPTRVQPEESFTSVPPVSPSQETSTNDQLPTAGADVPISIKGAAAGAESTEVSDQEAPTTESQIETVIRSWASATEANDPRAMAAFYGPEVNRYFLARNITNAEVLQDKEAFFNGGRHFNSYRIGQLNFDQVSPTAANVSIVKSYEFTDQNSVPISREVHSHLWLQNTGSGWKIVGEQDLLK
jgi:uncharacterized RDD family membrane protein YckC/ketosteroid isomerase-like protein